jgi:hypothetical protein
MEHRLSDVQAIDSGTSQIYLPASDAKEFYAQVSPLSAIR